VILDHEDFSFVFNHSASALFLRSIFVEPLHEEQIGNLLNSSQWVGKPDRPELVPEDIYL